MSESIDIDLQYSDLPLRNTAGAMAPAATIALFEQVFKTHFNSLHKYACSIVKDEAAGEEMVQNTFLKLWERKEQIPQYQNVTAYLYRAVHNESLNYLKHNKVKDSYRRYVAGNPPDLGHSDPAEIRELQQRIDEVMNELPEQCRTVFYLGRFEGLKYREIAGKLNISVKTVENQMGKALKRMREGLAKYLPLLLTILWIIKEY